MNLKNIKEFGYQRKGPRKYKERRGTNQECPLRAISIQKSEKEQEKHIGEEEEEEVEEEKKRKGTGERKR